MLQKRIRQKQEAIGGKIHFIGKEKPYWSEFQKLTLSNPYCRLHLQTATNAGYKT